MKTLKAKKDFSFKGQLYIKDDEVNLTDIKDIRLLNEKGFIYPLTLKELILIERELEDDFKKPNYRKEEE